jgi:integrase
MASGQCIMLRAAVDRYVALHRSTGYVYRRQEYILRNFAAYAEKRGDKVVRASTAMAWAGLAPIRTRHARLLFVQRFARVMRAEEPRHEVPPSDAFGPSLPRRTPHIFSSREIRALLNGAAALGPRGSLRPKVYVTLFGLLAATGLRISEALALQLSDITPDGLVIRDTKFRKNRLVPLHESTRRALNRYLVARSKCARDVRDEAAVFLSQWGTRLGYQSAFTTFRGILYRRRIGPAARNRRPRLHDLRHTFAVRSIEGCSGDREEVSRHMLSLSTYLGHARLADTYWYLQATPRLLADIAAQTEARADRGGQ